MHLDLLKLLINSIFNYYACNERFCVPKFDEFSVTFSVKNGKARLEYLQVLDKNYGLDSIEDNEEQKELNKEINKGLFSFILFSIGMGFISLLTPCVFPMIPITVSYFTKEGEKWLTYNPTKILGDKYGNEKIKTKNTWHEITTCS